MKKRTGRETFLQHVARIYADKAPSFYFIGMSTDYDRYIGDIISDVMNELTGSYRSRVGAFSNKVHESIFGDGNWKNKGFRVDAQPVSRDGPSPKEVVDLVYSMDSRQTLQKDRFLLVYSTTHEEFTQHTSRLGLSNTTINYDAFDVIDAAVASVKPRIEQARINLVSNYNSMDLRFSSDCTVFLYKVDGLPIITLFGNKDDEVYMFAWRDGTYEPVTMSQIFKPLERINHIKESEEKRAYFLYSANEFDINPLVAYSHNISKAAYYHIPTYVEEFTLLDAANTPFDELLKLAANVENGLTVFCNSQTNPKSDDIVEEAGKAWREGKYVSLTDSIQPGFSRSGTFMYKSERLKDLAVVSYNLLLEKEKS